MKRKLLFLVILVFISSTMITAGAEKSFKRQMFRNFNIGWDLNWTDNYRLTDFHLGTAYGRKFKALPKASWEVGANFNWSKYKIYSDGSYALSVNDDFLRTRSLSIPLTVSYDVFKHFFTGMKVYTGPSYEMIFCPTLNGHPYSEINPFQFGWTVGTRIRFLAIFSARLSYIYYPTGLFKNGDLNRSAVNFSIGF